METKFYITVDIPESNMIESYEDIVNTIEAEILGIIIFYNCRLIDMEIK